MNNRELLNDVVKSLDEYALLLAQAADLAAKIKNSSVNPRLNRGKMSHPQIIAQRQAIRKLVSLNYDMTSELAWIMDCSLTQGKDNHDQAEFTYHESATVSCEEA